MDSRPLKRIDILRHELKALRYILDNYHAGKLDGSALPPRDDFQADQARQLYDAIIAARQAALRPNAISPNSNWTMSISIRSCVSPASTTTPIRRWSASARSHP